MTAHQTYIIAEAGVNHDGLLEDALRLVDAAVEAGADCVKFQTFEASSLASAYATKAAYQQRTTAASESQRDMLHRLELPRAAHFELVRRAAERKIDFLSTPFDRRSLAFLVDDLGMKRIKISSGDLTNAPLLLDVARAGVDVILSTGMATAVEVEDALGVLAFGYGPPGCKPNRAAFAAAWADPSARAALRGRVALLHCTTEYPAPANSVNLAAMDLLRSAFGVEIGYSDHTLGIDIAVAAVARGASIIEKHLTLDRTRPGPDHAASLEPAEFKRMVDAIETIEQALGDGRKVPQPAEIKNMTVARKSLVAARRIMAGEIFNEENITCKRPGNGISPSMFWDLQGRAAPRDFEADEPIHS